MKPVKVMHVLPQIKIGGVESAALYLLNNLPSTIEYHLLCLEQVDQSLVDHLPEEVLSKRLHVIDGKRFSPITYIKAFKRVKSVEPTWLICSLWRSQPLLWLVAFFTSVSTAFIFHNNKFKHWADRFSSKLSLKLCDKICADSNASQEFLSKETQRTANIINHYIAHDKVNAIKQPQSMVFIGRIASNKGLDDAIKLLSFMLQLDDSWSLDIYGPDEGVKAELVALGESLGLGSELKYHNSLLPQQVPETLAKFSYLILPSKNEGMAMIVLEAMQQGLIPLVRPVGQIPSYTKDQHSALWLPDEIDISFAQRLQKLDNDLVQKQQVCSNIEQELNSMPTILCNFTQVFLIKEADSVALNGRGLG
ncbi:glycosyltransferase [Agarivorans sp. B2Z047]|uniref:glycosyltransferase family 4 protein n=1 Tax=Agarivorans sp. B2Z047 TaxID=2652721 RepID=UPI00128C552B|nr:glycosyltransferase family 4 protein [Agarivorans sp. B2Z047]MPW28751.1 glycosyltransferase [Agarivorans sp. B2Z047]UQN41312.1 glycosyltransferase family 4 protein [Agarivorans sp. B2Z047]